MVRETFTIVNLKVLTAVAKYHHERWDGNGYPDSLQGNGIPTEARIYAIVDVWDAIRYDRPYQKALSRDEAIKLMQELSGAQLDPTLVNIFLQSSV